MEKTKTGGIINDFKNKRIQKVRNNIYCLADKKTRIPNVTKYNKILHNNTQSIVWNAPLSFAIHIVPPGRDPW